MKKRVALIIGGIFLVLLVAILSLPFLINVDKYRPQIVEIANQHLNGKLEMGKLSLTLWGQIKIEIAGLTLADSNNHKVVAAKSLFFHIPVSSLLSGSPLLNLKMEKPELHVVKYKTGKMNVMTIAKVDTTAGKAEPAKPTPAEPAKARELPGMAKRARLGIQMVNAHMVYEDQNTQLKSEVRDLNVRVSNLSLSQAMDFEVSADLDTKMGVVFALKGPAVMSGKISPQFKGSEFESVALSAVANMDKVAITVPGVFEKKAGLATNASLSLQSTTKHFELKEFKAAFFNAELQGTGTVKEFDSPILKFSFKSNEVSFKPWSELLPQLKAYEVGGTANFVVDVWGTSEKPEYRANLEFKGVTAKAPSLKAQPMIDGAVKVVTDKVESILVTLKAPGNDLRVTGNVASFTKPNINIQATSTGMDLDQWMDFSSTKKEVPKEVDKEVSKEAGPGKESKTAASGKAAAGKEDFDAMLDPMRKNPVAVNTVARIGVDLKMVKAHNVKLMNLGGVLTLKNLAFGVEGFRMSLFSGQIKSNALVQMAPKTPNYNFSVEVAGLDLQEAVASQFELFKNTLIGKVSMKLDGNGSSFNPEPAMKNLTAKGNMKVENATFATLDIGKMVAEAISKSINEIGNKVPSLKGKNIGAPGSIDSKYSSVTSDFTISGGRFNAPNFYAKAEANKGIDLKGDTQVGMIDKSLNAKWEVIDSYNLTKVRDLSVEQQGVRVDHILADGDQPVKFPVEVGGTLTAPKYSYTSVPEALGKVALSNVGKAVAGKAKAEVQKKAVEQLNEVSKKAPPAVQEAIKKFGGGLFGN